jgi:RNA polymerase sporulation-specific sigma factor
LLISRESSDDIAHFIRKNLSPLERDVLIRRIDGQSHGQIAAALGKPLKSVDNTLQRVRGKMKRFAVG